jgi:molecular chaperone HtpG
MKIRNVLVSKILAWFDELATKENEIYLKYFKNFGSLFKTGLNSDFTNKEKITELLRFETSKTKTDEFISLEEYSLRMKSSQKYIYYIYGSAKELIQNNPNLEYFQKNEIEVLFLTDPVDIFTIPAIHEYKGKQLLSIEKADIDIINEDEKKSDNEVDKQNENNEKTAPIVTVIKEILGERVEDVIVSKRLVSSPVTLVIGATGMDTQMEKMMQMFNKDFQTSKRILEVNISHQLIKNLEKINAENPQSKQLTDAVEQLFEGALLIEGQIKDTNQFVKRMFEFMTQATS